MKLSWSQYSGTMYICNEVFTPGLELRVHKPVKALSLSVEVVIMCRVAGMELSCISRAVFAGSLFCAVPYTAQEQDLAAFGFAPEAPQMLRGDRGTLDQ